MPPGLGRLIELADTSAWTNRAKAPGPRDEFDRLIRAGRIATCAMVQLELLRSERDQESIALARGKFDALREVPMGDRVWRRAADVLELLAEAGPLHHRFR